MKRIVVPLFAAVLFASPASAEFVVRNIDLSIGIGSPPPRYEPKREVVYVDRRPDVVYVRDYGDRRDYDRWERRHQRRHHRDEGRDRRRDDTKVVVIDRGHHCDERGKVVVTRPGSVIVVADDRRW